MHPSLAPFSLRRETREGKPCLWDVVRRKWVQALPEEEVRQRLLHHLMEGRGIARPLISVEKEIQYHQLRKRFDVVVFDRQAQPLILAECKAPSVALSEATLQQIARYNAVIQAPHLLLTNGEQLLFFSRDAGGQYQFQPTGWWT
jgi:type I site-specific restriction endonuclease